MIIKKANLRGQTDLSDQRDLPLPHEAVGRAGVARKVGAPYIV